MAHLEFVVTSGGDRAHLNVEKLFPDEKSFPQKELVLAGPSGLYDQGQVDSEVEKRFVEDRLRCDDKVICYFKFPPSFRIPLLRIVGNYNPDWGILRWDSRDGRILLQLVRETKGSQDPRQLRFAHERRKIKAAKRHFGKLAVDYRIVTDEVVGWWESAEDV